MFGQSKFKQQVTAAIEQLETQMADLKKAEQESRAMNARLTHVVKNLGRKLIMRLPVSLESLEKGLSYDLIFPEEIEAWKKGAPGGVIVDLRNPVDFEKGALPGSMNIPLDQLLNRLSQFSRDQAFLFICDNGIKSASASELIHSKGYSFTYVLQGGVGSLRANKPEIKAEDVSSTARQAHA
jgi:rhodanese-related sulfurtransferase